MAGEARVNEGKWLQQMREEIHRLMAQPPPAHRETERGTERGTERETETRGAPPRTHGETRREREMEAQPPHTRTATAAVHTLDGACGMLEPPFPS